MARMKRIFSDRRGCTHPKILIKRQQIEDASARTHSFGRAVPPGGLGEVSEPNAIYFRLLDVTLSNDVLYVSRSEASSRGPKTGHMSRSRSV